MARKTNPAYPKEFREEALRLWRSSGRSGKTIALELGISDTSLYNWARQDDVDNGRRDGGLTTTERDEVAELRRRVCVLRSGRS